MCKENFGDFGIKYLQNSECFYSQKYKSLIPKSYVSISKTTKSLSELFLICDPSLESELRCHTHIPADFVTQTALKPKTFLVSSFGGAKKVMNFQWSLARWLVFFLCVVSFFILQEKGHLNLQDGHFAALTSGKERKNVEVTNVSVPFGVSS